MNRFSTEITRIAIAGFILVAAAGCPRAPAQSEETRPEAGTIFRHRWWNYYTRALDGADRQAYAAAQKDLEAAIAHRDRDQRMARTYGMHFVDYFPHREMGVIYWLNGDLTAARQELERSMADYPSAKARYYLDLVRTSLIQLIGAQVGPPELKITEPEGDYWTREDPVLIRGRVQDPNYVAGITIAGEPLFLEESKQVWDFERHLALPQGRHDIAVAATNLAGVTFTQTVAIHVDRQGPWVIADAITPTSGGLQFKGTVFDEAGVVKMAINGKPVPIVTGTRCVFDRQVRNDAAIIVFEARDRLGNTTVIPIERRALQVMNRPYPLVAALPSGIETAGLFKARDRTPPKIRLADWEDTQTVYVDQVVLSGSVHDPGQVTLLTINGEAALPQSGAMVLFSHFLSLKKGANRITIKAADAAGNQTVKQILIERKIPKVRLLSERLRLSIFAFERKGELSDISFAFQDNFIHQLVQQHRFQLIEREQLEHILQEHKISRSRLIDQATAVRLGRLVAAQVIVAGSMVETRTGVEIVGRVIDSETSEILTTADAYSEDKGLAGLKVLAKTMALKIHREFPLVDGLVVDKKKNMIFMDLGSEKIRAQRHIIVFQERPVHAPVTGKILGQDCQILGKARVIQAEPQMSKAELQPGCADAIHPQHKVMTQ